MWLNHTERVSGSRVMKGQAGGCRHTFLLVLLPLPLSPPILFLHQVVAGTGGRVEHKYQHSHKCMDCICMYGSDWRLRHTRCLFYAQNMCVNTQSHKSTRRHTNRNKHTKKERMKTILYVCKSAFVYQNDGKITTGRTCLSNHPWLELIPEKEANLHILLSSRLTI